MDKKICLLYVDDNRKLLKLLSIKLKRIKDFEIKMFVTSKELLEEFTTNRDKYSIAILDKKLSNSDPLNGLDVSYKINKELGNGIHTYIFSTSDGSIENNMCKDSIEELGGVTEMEASKIALNRGWIQKNPRKIIDQLLNIIEHYKSGSTEFLDIKF